MKLNELNISISFLFVMENVAISQSSTNIKKIKKESSVNKLDESISFNVLYKKKEKHFKRELTSLLCDHARKNRKVSSCKLYNEFIFPNNKFISGEVNYKLSNENILKIVDIIALAIRPKAKVHLKEINLNN